VEDAELTEPLVSEEVPLAWFADEEEPSVAAMAARVSGPKYPVCGRSCAAWNFSGAR